MLAELREMFRARSASKNKGQRKLVGVKPSAHEEDGEKDIADRHEKFEKRKRRRPSAERDVKGSEQEAEKAAGEPLREAEPKEEETLSKSARKRRAKAARKNAAAQAEKEEEEPVNKAYEPPHKNASNEIDDLFSGRKKKRPEPRNLQDPSSSQQPPKLRRDTNNLDGEIRYTEDGLRIYTYEELMRDQPEGLNGPCPFDCNCCF
mmetsp:Transcript_9323/g.28091  ORF Transcript_9323/g.28091 Transcript_9323/m.28091 type:complete len:205 (+) Transcript_9323:116-730(+)